MDNITTKHPYLSFEDQLSLLEERNLIIKDTDLALEAIQSFSYYTIVNGYKDLFLKSPYDNEFIDGTTFEMLYQLHWIDLSLCNTLFKYTLAVEKKLKTQVSNLVADCFTINEQRYLLDKNYSPAKGQKGKLRDVEKAIDEIRYRDISAKHYMDEENNLPPWIAAKAISFGNIRNWYSILRDPHKQLIIDAFIGKKTNLTPDTRRDFFKIALNQVYAFRNISAHGNRSFKLKLDEKDRYVWKHLKSLGIHDFFQENDSPANRDNLFSIILSMFILINDKYVLYNLKLEIEQFIQEYSRPEFIFLDRDIFQLFDIPKDTVSRLESYLSYKFPNN